MVAQGASAGAPSPAAGVAAAAGQADIVAGPAPPLDEFFMVPIPPTVKLEFLIILFELTCRCPDLAA